MKITKGETYLILFADRIKSATVKAIIRKRDGVFVTWSIPDWGESVYSDYQEPVEFFVKKIAAASEKAEADRIIKELDEISV